MNKITISIITFMFCCNLKGQSFKNDLTFNFGPSISSFYGNKDYKDFNSRRTYSLGLTYSYYCSEKLFLQSGLLFERKGASVGADFFDSKGNYYKTSHITFNRDYLTLPFTLSFVTLTRIKFYFGGGLFLDYLLSAQDINSSVSTNETFAAKTTQFDFGLISRVGFFIPLVNRVYLEIGLKDNLGLCNTLKNELPTKNNTFGILTGLKYKF